MAPPSVCSSHSDCVNVSTVCMEVDWCAPSGRSWWINQADSQVYCEKRRSGSRIYTDVYYLHIHITFFFFFEESSPFNPTFNSHQNCPLRHNVSFGYVTLNKIDLSCHPVIKHTIITIVLGVKIRLKGSSSTCFRHKSVWNSSRKTITAATRLVYYNSKQFEHTSWIARFSCSLNVLIK